MKVLEVVPGGANGRTKFSVVGQPRKKVFRRDLRVVKDTNLTYDRLDTFMKFHHEQNVKLEVGRQKV